MKKLIATILGLAAGVGLLYAVGLSGLVVNEPGLAYSKRYVFDLQNADVNTVSASAVYSSTTFSASTFSTGQVSTGSLTVASNTLLTAAAATNNITVISTSGAFGDSIVIPKREKPGAYVFLAGRDWKYGATTGATATSLGAALATIPWLAVNVAGSVIYTTAPVGGFYNSLGVTTNNTDTLTVAHATFTGGNDAPTVFINGYGFQAGRDYAIGVSASASATNLATAINARAGLSTFVTATPSSADIALQSKLAGALYNFPLATSNSSAVSVAAAAMVGGATPSWALNGKNIAVTAHGYTTGLKLLYTTGSGAAAISGLTGGTTYYAIPVDANTLQLASSSNNAQAGTGIVLASSSTLTAAKSYNLAPLAWSAGSAGFAWQTSNDNSTWTNMAVSSVTYSVPGSIAWDLGRINYRYLGFNVTGPSAGGLGLQVTAQGTYTY